MVGIAQTGTGKTLAFGIPMLQRLAQGKGRGLVVLPTRELAIQVEESLHAVGTSIGLRTALLIGGAALSIQQRNLRKHPHIIIATPGRLIDHLDQGQLHLRDVKILVLDEADRMLDMGFAPQLRRIIKSLPPVHERQTMMFSATLPDPIMNIARKDMRLPVRIEVARPGTAAELVEQEIFIIQRNDKNRLLEKILSDSRGSALIFSRTKHAAHRLARQVREMGHTATEIHSNRTLNQRKSALNGFRSGTYRVLVATDIAARGIDVTGIEFVINYDLPMNPEDYVHRIGRTGRAGRPGRAISFAMPDEGRDVKQIERLIRRSIKISQLPELPPARQREQTDGRRKFSPSQPKNTISRQTADDHNQPPRTTGSGYFRKRQQRSFGRRRR